MSVDKRTSIGRHRRPDVRRASGRRPMFRFLTIAFTLLVVLAAPALAYWSSTGTGAGAGSTATLAPPTGVTVAAVSLPAVVVNWTASLPPPSPTGYYLTRTTGGITTAAC